MKQDITTRERWAEVWRCAREDGGRIAWETRAGWMGIHRTACAAWRARRACEPAAYGVGSGACVPVRPLPLP
jgi:hypothetical protein